MIDLAKTRALIENSFSALIFKEDSHQYFLPQADGTQKELMCVSSFCDLFAYHVDFSQKAKDYALAHGETADYWLEQWEQKKEQAAAMGTQVHEYAESLAWLRNGHPEKICESARSQYDTSMNDLLPIEGESLMAKKEQAVYKFWKEMHPNLHFVMAEQKVCTGIGPYVQQSVMDYAGTFDLLLYYEDKEHPEQSGYCIFDYKTNKTLTQGKLNVRPQYLNFPFGDLIDEAKSHYAIQQSCYQLPLENIGLRIIGRRLVWLKDDGNYELVNIPLVKDQIKAVLNGTIAVKNTSF